MSQSWALLVVRSDRLCLVLYESSAEFCTKKYLFPDVKFLCFSTSLALNTHSLARYFEIIENFCMSLFGRIPFRMPIRFPEAIRSEYDPTTLKFSQETELQKKLKLNNNLANKLFCNKFSKIFPGKLFFWLHSKVFSYDEFPLGRWIDVFRDRWYNLKYEK